MEFLSYSILVIFEIIVSRNIMTISRQDSADKRCSRNSLILRSTQLLAIVPWHFYLYTKLTVYHIRKYTFRPFILHIAIIVASARGLFIAFRLSRNANSLTRILSVLKGWWVVWIYPVEFCSLPFTWQYYISTCTRKSRIEILS